MQAERPMPQGGPVDGVEIEAVDARLNETKRAVSRRTRRSPSWPSQPAPTKKTNPVRAVARHASGARGRRSLLGNLAIQLSASGCKSTERS